MSAGAPSERGASDKAEQPVSETRLRGEDKGRSAPRTWFEAAAAPRRRRSLDDRDGRTDGRRWPLARGELNPPSPCRALRCAGIASISLRLAAPERTSGQ